MTKNGTLTTNERRALEALLTCATVRDAAKRANLGPTTVYRYLADPAFKAALRARQDQVIAGAVAALAGLAGDAVEALRDVLDDDEASHGVRVRAALGVLAQVQNMIELRDLVDRVAALEARA